MLLYIITSLIVSTQKLMIDANFDNVLLAKHYIFPPVWMYFVNTALTQVFDVQYLLGTVSWVEWCINKC